MGSDTRNKGGVLDVKGLSKKYPSFELKDVCFYLEKGKITGFIGRNGAGKSTTLKSLLNFVHPDKGEVEFFGYKFSGNEERIKQKIGFVSGGVDYYTAKKLKVISDITKRFYSEWDDSAYNHFMKLFALDENKTPAALSAGMKVKYALVLALSHNAELLILDEPTSGLDPVSRDELLDIFIELCESGKTILFSTHITTDLDKCADNIIYIKGGKIIDESPITDFVGKYRLVGLETKCDDAALSDQLIGLKREKIGYSAIVTVETADKYKDSFTFVREADLEAIMVHMEKEPAKKEEAES